MTADDMNLKSFFLTLESLITACALGISKGAAFPELTLQSDFPFSF